MTPAGDGLRVRPPGRGDPEVDPLAATLAALEALDRAAVARLAEAVCRTHARGGTVFFCGNGGSATTASHFAHDLAKSTLRDDADGDRVRAIALNDAASGLTAWANDSGYETVFEQPLRALARPGDLLVAISGSGNSRNVLNAVRWAGEHGLGTFGLTGFDGGALRDLAQDAVHVPVAHMEVAENAHVVVMHLVVRAVRRWKCERPAAAAPVAGA